MSKVAQAHILKNKYIIFFIQCSVRLRIKEKESIPSEAFTLKNTIQVRVHSPECNVIHYSNNLVEKQTGTSGDIAK